MVLSRDSAPVVITDDRHDVTGARDPAGGSRRIHPKPGRCDFLDSPVVAEPISRAGVEHVAKLARLALTDAEIEDLTAELASILGHAADIEALALDDVPPTSHVVDVGSALREDVPQPSLPRDVALASAPAVQDGGFLVPSPQAAA